MGVENAPGIGEVGRARASVRALEVLTDIRASARQYADDAERTALAGWSGWGPLAKAFADANKSEAWAQIAEQIGTLLPEDHVKMGLRGTYNAFFTPRAVAKAMWELLGRLGFDGDTVAELGCGAGVFLSTAPDGVLMTGVERDPTSADIARLLNPGHTVVTAALQKTPLPGSFGAVIGNVPFGDVRIFDPSADEDSAVRRSLHDYFLWRACKALAPGGLAVLLTSRFTMDAREWDGRAEIAGLADFVGAIRLPSGGLEGGTQAVADVLVLRRKGDGTLPRAHDWMKVTDRQFGYDNPINAYWSERPGNVLGTMVEGKTPQYGLGVLVEPIAGETPAAGIRRVGRKLAAEARDRGLMWTPPPATEELDDTGVTTTEGWLEGSFHRRAGQLLVVKHGQANPVPKPGRELLALVGMKEMAERLVELEADHDLADEKIDPLRRDLFGAYQRYVKQFGCLNRCTIVSNGVDPETGIEQFSRRNPPMGGFRHDPGSALVFALEMYDHEAKAGEPAPLLLVRQNRRVVLPMSTDDPATALAWCLDRKGGVVDLDFISALLGRHLPAVQGCPDDRDRLHEQPDDRDRIRERIEAIRADTAQALGDLVFQQPGDRRWVTAEEYLSGDVRAKHLAAKTAARHDDRFQRNVRALQDVLPRWLAPGEIMASLGTPWIPTGDVAKFIEDLLGAPADEVRRIKSANRWEIKGGLAVTARATEEWGTQEIDGYSLIELALNGKTPTVRRRVGEHKTVKDDEATLRAAEAQARIKARFAQWVWEDPERCERLVTYYNNHHNCLVTRKYNGDHLTIPGLAKTWAAKLYPHQKEFIGRVLATPATLCGHPVGAGKTATMTCAAMKLKSVGLVDKPMLVVPNHLLEQADAAARQMFPAAKIVSASSKTIAKNRRSFTALVARQPWDLVIITQSAWDVMPVHPNTEREYLEGQLAALYDSIVDASPRGELEGRMVKNMAKRMDRLEERIRELRNRAYRPDGGVTFEQLGVRWVGIDEAHAYKNLAVPCNNDGFNINPSKRATGLDMKLRWLAKHGSGRYAALFTGTPVSNTMLELYVMMQYTMPEYLSSIGLGSADAWVAAYVEMVTKVGVNINGSDFEIQTRPARFINAPELRVLFSLVADIRTAEQLGLKRPAADERVIKVQPTRAQQAYAEWLVSRAQKLKGVRFPGKGQDNMLKVCNDGRWMATDPALVGIDDPEPGKLHAVAENVMAVYRANPEALQIAFCDVGTPSDKKGDQTYGRLRDLLVEMGIPRHRVRFVHEAKDGEAKARLFAACREGRVSVIMGSTGALGTGTNIQDRVCAMHHIDAPYTPSGVEQRDGRGLRPGNCHETVRVYRYVTARTFDAYLWQMLVRKLTFITQLMSGSLDRAVEDCATEQLMSFSLIEAAATDQPLLMERADVEVTVNRLRTMQSGHRMMVARQKRQIPMLIAEIDQREAELRSWRAIAGAQVPEMTEELAEQLHAAMEHHSRYSPPVVQVGGLTVRFGDWFTSTDHERNPRMLVDAGQGPQEDRLYRSFKPATIGDRLIKLVAKAEVSIKPLTGVIDGLRAELADKERIAASVFEQADELVAAQARLDQIDAELKRAASGHEDSESAIVLDSGAVIDIDGLTVAEPTAALAAEPSRVPEPDIDPSVLEEMDDVFGELLSSYEQRLEREMSEAMALLGM